LVPALLHVHAREHRITLYFGVMAFDNSLLAAALVGYHAEAARITAAIADIKQRLGQRSSNGNAPATPVKKARKRHQISAEGRARIAEAQRKRWAAAKKK
jgi:hypothetical protein